MSVLYLDTEFNGFGGELISLALAPSEIDLAVGVKLWYEELELPEIVDPWVKVHVVPKLVKVPLRPLIFRSNFQQYILQFNDPLIICDWHADAVHFCKLLAGPDYGSSLDFAFRMSVIKTPKNEPIYSHNALEDAQILKSWYGSK